MGQRLTKKFQTNAHWILVTGPTGAGKTTLGRAVAEQTGGVLFSIDEWMNNLFWMDCPKKNDLAWALNRVARCEAQIAVMARQLVDTDVPVVLDLGFTQRKHRTAWLERAKVAGIPVELVVVDGPAELRWERVRERNSGASSTYEFAVTREMFEMMEARWETPCALELSAFAG